MMKLLRDNWFPLLCVIFAAGGGWTKLDSLERAQVERGESIKRLWVESSAVRSEQASIKETLSRLEERSRSTADTINRIENKLDKRQ